MLNLKSINFIKDMEVLMNMNFFHNGKLTDQSIELLARIEIEEEKNPDFISELRSLSKLGFF